MEQLLAQTPALLLAATRAIGLMTASPIFSNRFVPFQVRVALSFILGFFILPALTVPPERAEGANLLGAALVEMLVGLVIGFLTMLILSVLQMAGAVIDLEMGFTLVNLFDPMTGQSDTILGSLFQTLALVIFLAVDGHHWLIRSLVQSYDLVPAGGPLDAGPGGLYMAYLFGDLLALALQLVLPFLAVMLLTTVAFAALNRAVAQLNIFAIGLGSKTFVGLVLLILLLPFYAGPLTSLVEAGYEEVLHVLELMRATQGG
jgi:flagellar biosynthetic protein FliR